MSQSHFGPFGPTLFEEAWAAMQGMFPAGSSALSLVEPPRKGKTKCDRKGHIWNPVECGGFEIVETSPGIFRRVDANDMGMFTCRRCHQHDFKPFRRAASNAPPINNEPSSRPWRG